MDDSFEIYDLKVEVTATERPMVCSHHVGDYFLVEGENLVFPENTAFSMYARFKITRTRLRRQSHGACTVVPLEGGTE